MNDWYFCEFNLLFNEPEENSIFFSNFILYKISLFKDKALDKKIKRLSIYQIIPIGLNKLYNSWLIFHLFHSVDFIPVEFDILTVSIFS